MYRSLSRTVTNVRPPSEYKVKIQEPPLFQVTVQPEILRFKYKGKKKEFNVTFTLRPHKKDIITDYEFGRLIWTDGNHHVGTPITIMMYDN